MEIHEQFDPDTFTLTYVVFDPVTRDAVVIDSVLDYDQATATTSTRSADALLDFIRDRQLHVHYVLETHAHADHVSASPYLRTKLGAKIAIGERIREVQKVFEKRLELRGTPATDGRQFDRLLEDGETVHAGSVALEVLSTPGHTPACLTYKVGDAIFTGDALFIEDYGVGRCDFPGGSADELYTSVHDRLYALPDDTRVFVGHDYLPNGRALRFQTTIGACKRGNVLLAAATPREAFVTARKARDKGLAAPRLLIPSVTRNVFPDAS